MAETHERYDAKAVRCAGREGIVLCPLRYEQRQLQRAGLDRVAGIECCGPGADNVARWFERHEQRAVQASWLMLVGVAGSIDTAAAPGTAHVVTAVIDQHDDRRRNSLLHPAGERRECMITSSNTVIDTPEGRAALSYATGAHLVDQESASFAACADQLGVRWGIVRGVSDGMGSRLPRRIEQWVDDDGRTRVGRVLLCLLFSPGDLLRVLALGRTSRRAMRAATSVVREVIDECSKQTDRFRRRGEER